MGVLLLAKGNNFAIRGMNKMRKITRSFLFVGLLPLIYLLSILLFSKLHFKGRPLLYSITRNYVVAGGWGQSLRKFREIDTVKDVDLLFLGSSHVYRGFDPRYFAEIGYSSFNMGTSSQTPLNSFFLLKKYFEQLNPKLIVLEVYPLLLSTDGIESYFDLVVNMQHTKEIVEMAFALKTPLAINSLVGTKLERINHPLSEANQKEIENEIYISGGYCETKQTKNGAKFTNKISTISTNDSQIKYLSKIIAYAKQHRTKIVLVTQPLPNEYLNTIKNYATITRKISEIACESNVIYIDYNSKVTFNTGEDFFDKDHLTVSGVKKFNSVFSNDMLELRMFPPKTNM